MAPEPIEASVEKGWLARNFTGKAEFVFQAAILGLICILAFSVRLFSVLRFESVIHEFDPWFNFRSTRFLVEEGFYNFHNWFDNMSWYPLGRFIGGTVYPGLMYTAAAVYHLLDLLHLTVDIRNVCVLLAPWMAGNTAIATYLFTKEVWNSSAGLFAAAFVSIAPGYISRSVAGSYDNEACAIFAMVFCFYLWVRAVKTGTMLWAALAALGYYYMVTAWGGYIFIINIIPAHVFLLILAGRYSHRLYVAYCTFYVLGTLLSMQVMFVSWAPVSSPEHLAAFGVFVFLQVYTLFIYLKALMAERPDLFRSLLRYAALAVLGMFAAVVVLAVSGQIPFLTGRLWALLGATSNIAIVKSVSEHQPSPWTTFFFDLHLLTVLAPVGLHACFKSLSDANLFIILYVLFASYFSSIMVRLVLVLTPAMCVMAGIGASLAFQTFMDSITAPSAPADQQPSASADDGRRLRKGERGVRGVINRTVALVAVIAFLVLFAMFVIHCNWATSTAYSSPSIVLAAHGHDGERIIFDDFREAYMWLQKNTPPDAKILSWWDYGYQITGMGNRTVIVDNNTRNNTHIATVGLVMASSEERAWPILRMLDVSYVLVVFGGRIGYSSDDINKFLWMVRISGGVFPEVVESDYLDSHGHYRVDAGAPPRMLNSLMYKMCYYRFGELQTVWGKPPGFDRVRGTEIGDKRVKLTHLEEAFTSEHWMVRIYRVKNDVTHPNFRDKMKFAL